MTRPDEPYYVMYDADFGLSGLAGRPEREPVSVPLPGGGADGDEQIGVDARSLLASGLPEPVIRTLWLAADRGRFDPAGPGGTVRSWLTAWSEAYPPPAPKKRPQGGTYISAVTPYFYPRPVLVEAELRAAVLAEIDLLAADLARAVPVPGAVGALRSAVAEAGADLGLRLLLRTLKAHSVRVDKACHDRFVALGDTFEYCFAVITDGLDVDWPPLDVDRRDSAWDFGLSALAERFAGDWHDRTARETVRLAADSDGVGQTPGSAAALLLADVTRLLGSPLSPDTLGTLWLAACDGGYRIDRFSIDVRHWLELVADVCREHLREVAPGHRAGAPPAPPGPVAEVLRELRDLAPELADRSVQPMWHPVPGAAVVRALEEVVAEVDPDLGFRLFLRALVAMAVPLSEERYARLLALGERFGYGEFHVSQVDGFVQRDL
ncbi:hypothetical protein DI272_30835 [Streptomyces sp. Act143]|uniref:hypothetical protein n=1 Tax=Streptomyces sp. Act143 TaxID=2200760 RepID=UPI000D680182|nr:hypothetical protein [Streptomyces sp. Act143]PWI18057.1 hypothetical protein DI272_30835 [Streptomyces sp. Act143]